jgi:hypothetical protein
MDEQVFLAARLTKELRSRNAYGEMPMNPSTTTLKRSALLLASLILSACGGGGGGAGSGGTAAAPTALFTSLDIVKVPVNASVTINVRAADASGNIYPTKYDVVSASPNSCVTFPATIPAAAASSTAASEITLTAVAGVAYNCSEVLTISGGNLSKQIKVHVYDPKVMDIGQGLLIRYVDDYVPISQGSLQFAGDPNSGYTTWLPVAPAGETGWYALGTLGRFNQDQSVFSGVHNWRTTDLTLTKTSYAVPMIMVKDTSAAQNLLADPLWQINTSATSFSGADCGYFGPLLGTICSSAVHVFWSMACPSGYGALGSVAVPASTTGTPPANTYKCVRNDFLVQGKFPQSGVNSLSWTHVVLSNNYHLKIYKVTEPDVTSNGDWIALSPGTFVACSDVEDANNPLASCGINPASVAKYSMLKIPVSVIESADTSSLLPKLTSLSSYYEEQTPPPPPVYLSSVRLPFTLMAGLNPDGAIANSAASATTYGMVDSYVNSSPFVYLQRVTKYEQANPALSVKNATSSSQTTGSVTITNGWDQTTSATFSKETSVKVSAGGNISFMGMGATASVEIGTTYNWTSSTSSTFTGSTSIQYGPYTVLPGSIFEAVHQSSYMDVLKEDGSAYTRLPLGHSPETLLSYSLP